MKKLLFLLLICLFSFSFLSGQPLTSLALLDAYEMLERQYPVLKNSELLDQLYEIDLNKLEIDTRPDIRLKADGRIQSQVTKFPGEGAPFQPDLPLYSIKTYVEGNYVIYDGGVEDAQKQQKTSKLLADKQAIQVEKFGLRERINSIFVAILLNREQLKLLDITLLDLDTRREVLAAGIELGTVLESEVSKIDVRKLEIKANKSDLILSKKALVATLSALIGAEVSQDVTLIFPDLPSRYLIPEIDRPEQTYFRLQKQALLSNEKLLELEKKPKLAAYAQAGFGYPNPLNFFDNGFSPFAVGGLSFQWKITDWDKENQDKQRLHIAARQFDNQQATFEFNLNTQNGKYLAELERLEAQIENRKEIVDLQADILKQLAIQLEYGVITTTEYLIQANAELLARQKLELQQTQLLKTQLEFLNNRGGLIQKN